MNLQLQHFYSWTNLSHEKIFGLLVEKTEKWLHFRLWDQEYNQEWDGWMLVNSELITDFVEIQEIPPQDGNFLPQEFLFGKSFEKFFYKKVFIKGNESLLVQSPEVLKGSILQKLILS